MKSKSKIIAFILLIAAFITGIIIVMEEKIKGLFTPAPANDAVSATPPVTASMVQEEGSFLGDEIINMVAANDYTLTVPVGTVRAQFQAQENQVVLRLGASPVMGGFLCDVEEIQTLETAEEVKKAVFRTKTGNATLVINYFSA